MRCFGGIRATWAVAAVVVLLGACTLPALESATPTPTPTPTVAPTPTASPSPDPATPSAEPTPDPAAIPDFAAGEIVASLIDGLRVRQRPGLNAVIATGLLPLNAEMEVIMGPFPVDDFGWYLVSDVDPAEPQFDEGWVAAGYEPDPLLRATGRAARDVPYLTAMAATGDAEEGPIEIGEGDHAIRWIARDPEAIRCSFAVSLAAPGGKPVQTIRATVGSGIDRGTLQPQTFDALGVRGTAFASVVSDCTWALVMLRVVEPSPDPSASSAP
jgi:hypothetical protein